MTDIRPMSRWEQAERDVATTTPPPKYPPLYAAVCVGFAASLACAVFAGILGIEIENPKAGQATIITSLIAGLVTYFPLRSMENTHSRAVAERYRELTAMANEQKH